MDAGNRHIHVDAGVGFRYDEPIRVETVASPVPYMNSRARSTVQPKTLDALLNHFGEVVGRKRSPLLKEGTGNIDKSIYLKEVEKEIKLFEQFGYGLLKENMDVTGVSKQYERYADGSTEKIEVPPHNIYVNALHNVSLWINPNPIPGEVVIAEIATNAETHLHYEQKGWKLLPHKVKALNEILEREPAPLVAEQEVTRMRMETWKYTTKADLVKIMEAGTDKYLPAVDWPVTLHSKSNNNGGCKFDKNAFQLLLMHYCGLHCAEIRDLPEETLWKGKARAAAVKAHGELANGMTMHMWALHLAKHSPQLPKYII